MSNKSNNNSYSSKKDNVDTEYTTSCVVAKAIASAESET